MGCEPIMGSTAGGCSVAFCPQLGHWPAQALLVCVWEGSLGSCC